MLYITGNVIFMDHSSYFHDSNYYFLFYFVDIIYIDVLFPLCRVLTYETEQHVTCDLFMLLFIVKGILFCF